MTINEYYEDYKRNITSIIDSSLSEEDLANDVALRGQGGQVSVSRWREETSRAA